MEILNSEVRKHVLGYEGLLKDLKKDHPDLTDEKLTSILQDKDLIDTRKVATDSLIWPYQVGSEIFVPIVRYGIPKATRWTREKVMKACNIVSFIVNWFWLYGIINFIFSLILSSRPDWLSLFLPVLASMAYYVEAKYFNMVYIIAEVECYYYEHQETIET